MCGDGPGPAGGRDQGLGEAMVSMAVEDVGNRSGGSPQKEQGLLGDALRVLGNLLERLVSGHSGGHSELRPRGYLCMLSYSSHLDGGDCSEGVELLRDVHLTTEEGGGWRASGGRAVCKGRREKEHARVSRCG